MMTGGFPEPLTFSLRARRAAVAPPAGRSTSCTTTSPSVGACSASWTTAGRVIGTCHHPVTVDRLVDMAHAGTWRREVSLRRWYGFVGMQNRVARRLPRILTVSSTSRRDIVEQMGVAPERVAIVPIGADHELFRPLPGQSPGSRDGS